MLSSNGSKAARAYPVKRMQSAACQGTQQGSPKAGALASRRHCGLRHVSVDPSPVPNYTRWLI